MRKNKSLSVLVVGGGIGGLSAALCLARKNFSVTMLEKRDLFREVGAGLQISPNAGQVLQELGLGEALENLGVKPQSLDVFDGIEGSHLAHIPLNQFMEMRHGFPYYTISRTDLHQALAEAAMQHANIDIHFDSHVTSVGFHGETVAVTVNENRDFDADVMIGADGIWSAVRKLVSGDSAAKYTGHTAWRAMIDANEAPENFRRHAVQLWLGPKTHLVHYPVCAGEKINIVAITESSWKKEGWSHPGRVVDLIKHFSDWDSTPKELLAAMGKPLKWALCGRDPDYDWHGKGRVTLLGDAAHPMLPYLAQGAAMAIEDAYILADELEAGLGEDPVIALRSYENKRAPRTGRVQKSAFDNARLYHLNGAARIARNMALRAAGAAPGLFMKRYNWLYGKNVMTATLRQPGTKRYF